MAGTIVKELKNFAVHQGRLMVRDECTARTGGGPPSNLLGYKATRSAVVGASCLAYALPGVFSLMYFSRPSHYPEAALYFLTAFNSLLSDWLTAGVRSQLHLADRFSATTSFLVTVAKCALLPSLPAWAIAFTFFFPSLYFLKTSRSCRTHDSCPIPQDP
eukprot:gene328-2404_t